MFDAAGQLTSRVSPNETQSFAYDPAGRRVEMTDASGTTTYTYDPAGRVTEIASPAGTVTYGWNAAGDQTLMGTADALVATSYDTNGFVAETADWAGDTIAYVNDPDGRLTTTTYANGVTTTNSYDTAGRLDRIDHNLAVGSLFFDYTLDANGNRVAVDTVDGTETYTLDALNRLTNATYTDGTSEVFGYDAAGNRTSRTDRDGDTVTYTLDQTGALVSDSDGVVYTTDNAGNLVSSSVGAAYVWDDHGRLVEATIDGVTDTAGWNANGELVDTIDYTAFGQPLNPGSTTFGFAGEHTDPTGLVHLRARPYDPGTGRFLAIDPVQPGSPGTTGWQHYAYAVNNPSTWTDPTGQTVLIEYAGLTAEQADQTDVVASSIANCAVAGLQAASQGLETGVAAPDPGRAVLRECAIGAAVPFGTALGLYGLGKYLDTDVERLGPRSTADNAVPNSAADDAAYQGVEFLDDTTRTVPQPLASANPIGGVGNGNIVDRGPGIQFKAAPTRSGSDLPQINGRRPINGKDYAGSTHPSGVRFDSDGFPDFSPHAVDTVQSRFLLTGNVDTDLATLGLNNVDGYTWHHVQDGFTMQLVPTKIHMAARHTGGAAVSEMIFRNLISVLSLR
ncbi:MAG: RHS repeat-associated core domain-containing protein [Acidimicrobiales bacterium]